MRQHQAGTVWVNRYSRTLDFILPTGGYKRSGIGKDLGREAVVANLRQQERADRHDRVSGASARRRTCGGTAPGRTGLLPGGLLSEQSATAQL